MESTLLIVDDDPNGRYIMESMLEGHGYRLVCASNGLEALELAVRITPDLVLLDVMMPDMDGFEVCRRLRSDPVLDGIPIIMVTALDDRASRLQGIEAGADDFITKPVDMTELRARVRTITRLNRYQRLLKERTRFEWVVENTQSGYLIIDQNDQIRYANPLARRYLDLNESDLGAAEQPVTILPIFSEVAQRTYHYHPANAWDDWPAQCASTIPRYLVLPETPDVRAFWLQVDAIAVPDPANQEYLVRLHDVTEKLTFHHDMHGFHAMIPHKLRTPMVGLLGSLDMIMAEASESNNEDMQEFARIAHKSAQRLAGDINDIMRYVHTASISRSDEGFCFGMLPSIIGSICTSLELEHVNVLLNARMHTILARETMEVIFWELLENAKKFHPTHTPHIDIIVSRLNEHQARIQVCDDGVHLSPAELSNLFVPYYQAEKIFTGEVAGMGLGLSTFAALVWGVGGTCRVYNRENSVGVVVEFILPVGECP